jgi:uncharacterized small protein (DUF1192 family)
MIHLILYFLSRFSVKIKVAFLIIFLISGVLFWNFSFLNDSYKQHKKTQRALFAFETAQKLNRILFSLQKERAYSIAVATHGHVKSDLKKVRLQTDARMIKFNACRENLQDLTSTKINAKITLLTNEIAKIKSMRLDIDQGKVEGDEIVRYYTDALIKHFIDLVALMTAHIESNDFNAYFNLISAIEYTALQQSLIQVAVGREEVFDQLWYDLIITQDAKAQTYLDHFKTFADTDVISAYYKLYSTPSFIHLNQMLEELKSQVGKKVNGIDITLWLHYHDVYMDNIKKVEALNSSFVETKIDEVLKEDSERFNANIVMLVLPLVF